MSIAKMSMNRNSNRYFMISVNSYKNGCMAGTLYQAGKSPGIRFENFLEMVLYMNRIFDEMACPKRTMDYRRFCGTSYPEPAIRECSKVRYGKLATFQIQVKYRYNASWQGEITWLEGREQVEFESFLQMLYWIEQILSDPCELEKANRASNIYQIAVDSFEDGLLKGSVQNAFLNYLEDFTGTIALADAMGHFIGYGGSKEGDSGGRPAELKLISDEVWNAYREGGKKSTFLIKILFREHSTWQGVICWRETGEKQAFRSFMELLFLMVSAVEAGAVSSKQDNSIFIDYKERALMEG